MLEALGEVGDVDETVVPQPICFGTSRFTFADVPRETPLDVYSLKAVCHRTYRVPSFGDGEGCDGGMDESYTWS